MVSQGPSQIKVTVGRNIRAARDLQKISQHELAVRLDCHAMLISKWERGLHSPSRHNLQALSDTLERPVSWFYTDHNGSDEPTEVAA